jgi:hypothetical protein
MINAKTILLMLCGIGLGVGSYFITRPSKDQLRQQILAKVSPEDRNRWLIILQQMTRQELVDTAYVLQFRENTPQSIIDKIDPAIKARIAAISNKYNIFT